VGWGFRASYPERVSLNFLFAENNRPILKQGLAA